ncbi:MAG: DUF423 domain-containing protein [Polyangiaceae bacterium]
MNHASDALPPSGLWIRIAGALGFLGVALGAFGAHGLRGKIPENLLSAYHTGVLYHLVHAVAILALALHARATGARLTGPLLCLSLGILLFSGSLYVMAISGATRLGMITPFGGVLFLVGWAWVSICLGRRA